MTNNLFEKFDRKYYRVLERLLYGASGCFSVLFRRDGEDSWGNEVWMGMYQGIMTREQYACWNLTEDD